MRALSLIGLVLLAVCALPPVDRNAEYLRYDITNFNWAQATVTFRCEGMLLDREHAIETGERIVGRIPLRRTCHNPEFEVTLLARNEIYDSGVITAWDRASTLFIRIENNVRLTSFRVFQ